MFHAPTQFGCDNEVLMIVRENLKETANVEKNKSQWLASWE